MKKVFIMAYARKNLGDDLFIKMLLDRYPENEFYMKVENEDFVKYFSEQYSNFNFIQGPDTDDEIYEMDVNNYDEYVYVGGSIFMEGGKVYNLSKKFLNFIERCKKNNKHFCYVSCNYGPYQTQEYFNLSKKTFSTCTDICFRDLYSYNLFRDIGNVRYAPDFAFTYPVDYENKISDSVGISVIDLSIRNDLKNKEQEYINMLKNNINHYINLGKKVYLFSFCEHEGDENAINKVVNSVGENPNLYVVKFDGNVEKFLDTYCKMEYMICARFHAMILSTISRQKVFIMSYSKKIDNVVNDLKLNIPIIHFNDLNDNMLINFDRFVNVDENIIKQTVDDAQGQEQVLKLCLKK